MIKEGKLPEKKMVRSDVSGKLFMSDECEVVVFKIIKGLNEDINDLFAPKQQVAVFNKETPVTRTQERTEPAQDQTVYPVLDRPAPRMRGVIPAGILAVMKPHDSPGSATEIRNV